MRRMHEERLPVWKILRAGVLAIAAVAVAGCAAVPESDRLSTPEPSPASAWDSGALTLGIVGDSLTAGHMADSEESTYRAQVEDASYPGTLTLRWVAVPGGTSATLQRQSGEVIAESDVVLIATGTNDTTAQPDISILNTQYPALLATVPDDKTLLCLGPWIRDAASNDAVQAMCEEAGGKFISIADLRNLRGPAGEAAYPQPRDNFHPNQAGHDAIAKRVIRALRAL